MTLAADTPRAREILGMFTPARTYRHTAGDLERWLEDAGLEIMEPGVMDVLVVSESGHLAGKPAAGAPGFIAGVLASKP
jgi:hypothetical protein